MWRGGYRVSLVYSSADSFRSPAVSPGTVDFFVDFFGLPSLFWISFILLPKVIEKLGLFPDHFAY
jgi:hypothetical protein